MKKIAIFFYKFLTFLNYIFHKITNRNFLVYINEAYENDAYKSIIVQKKKINFFVPNYLTNYRVDTFFSKEPETLEWINNFANIKKIIFWDIGSNIGLYSIYAAIKHDNISVISFEPSTSNLRVLSRNLSINNLNKKVKISQFPLTTKNKGYQLMMESSFKEGGALHSYGKNINYEGKKINIKNNYMLYGFSIDYIINHLDFEIPDYIKIDVDGLEHNILEGGKNMLTKKKIKGLLIEVNENYTEQFNKVKNIMKRNGFKLKAKEQSKLITFNKEFKNSFNYIFYR